MSDEEWENSINDEISDLLSHVNIDELVRIGSALNKGRKCTFEKGKHLGVGSIMGCVNYHAWLHFDNGERWLVRIPRVGFSDIPTDLMDYIVLSEYATLKFLAQTKVPVPKVFGYGLASDPANRVGVSYVLMQALSGRLFQPSEASAEDKASVLRQYARILVELAKYPMQRIGSFTMVKDDATKEDKLALSAVASNAFIVLDTHGPYKTSLEYITSTIEQHLDLISDGQLHPEAPVEAFLFYHFLRQNTAALMPNNTAPTNKFYLKHASDQGDHILLDENDYIIGIIDWQFARTVPAAEAFGPSYLTADPVSLYTSHTYVTDDDRLLAQFIRDQGSPDLAALAEGNEIMRRFHNGLAGGSSPAAARDLLQGMVACVLGAEVEDFEAWITAQMDECRSDPRWAGVQALLAEQELSRKGGVSAEIV